MDAAALRVTSRRAAHHCCCCHEGQLVTTTAWRSSRGRTACPLCSGSLPNLVMLLSSGGSARGCGYRPVEQPPGGAIRRYCCPEATWRQTGGSQVLLPLLPEGTAGRCCHRNATEQLVTTNVALPPCGVARRCHHGRLVGRTGAAATEEAWRSGPPLLLCGGAASRCCHCCC